MEQYGKLFEILGGGSFAVAIMYMVIQLLRTLGYPKKNGSPSNDISVPKMVIDQGIELAKDINNTMVEVVSTMKRLAQNTVDNSRDLQEIRQMLSIAMERQKVSGDTMKEIKEILNS